MYTYMLYTDMIRAPPGPQVCRLRRADGRLLRDRGLRVARPAATSAATSTYFYYYYYYYYHYYYYY